MLKVVKIIEGGIDLVTQEELPRSLIISNGMREIAVPANDIVIREVVELIAEYAAKPPNVSVEDVSRYTEPNAPATPPRANMANPYRRTPPSPQVVNQAPSPFEDEEEGPRMPIDEDGFEPGEEFNDGGTGAGSL